MYNSKLPFILVSMFHIEQNQLNKYEFIFIYNLIIYLFVWLNKSSFTAKFNNKIKYNINIKIKT